MKSETPRQAAERIAYKYLDSTDSSRQLQADIEAALKDRDERAAKIAETAFKPAHTYASESAERYYAFDDGQRYAMKNIAAAIRGGKTDAN